MAKESRPGLIWSILSQKCPRCRRGKMFRENNPWKLKKTLSMHPECPVCGQRFELEVGFWYGTSYVSYALSVALSVATFVAWYVLVGMSIRDNRFFWWMGLNIILLVVLQPWLMRISRTIWVNFFVKYDPEYAIHKATTFDYDSESYYRAGNENN